MHLARFGIEDIGVALGQNEVSPAAFGFDVPADYFQNVSGPKTLFACGPEEDAFSLCCRATEQLLLKRQTTSQQLDAIFVVTLPTEPTVAPISARLQGHLGARPDTFCLDLTLSCVGFLQAASLILDLMPARGWKKVLLLNVETLTKIIRPDDVPLRLIMSDGATASLFSSEPRLHFERFEFFSEGELAPLLATRAGQMFMDGAQVYETVLRRIPNSFRDSLKRFGLEQSDIGRFLFHQGSKKILDKLIELLDLDPSRVPLAIDHVGNLGSCSLPHLLESELRQSSSGPSRIFATAFGAGFQWAHALMRKGD